MPTTPTKIVFLIDEQSLVNSFLQLDQLKIFIMRTLLFYYTRHKRQQILWGYRFFSTQTRYPTDSIRHFYTMTEDSFNAIDNDYEKRNRDRPKQTVLGTPIMRIKQVLKEVIGDFQWENTDLCTLEPTKNYIFLLTACPCNGKDLTSFFITPHQDDHAPQDLLPYQIPQYFQQTKDELCSTLLQTYTQRHLSLSLVDTDLKCPHSNPSEQMLSRMIRQGFMSCFEPFHGNYILFQSFVRNNAIYGHSFISEFVNILPSDQPCVLSSTSIPMWKGPFKTKLGKSIGNFAIYPALRNGEYQTSTLAYISEIRTTSIVHASQFSISWLLKNDPAESDTDYKLTCEEGESPNLFNILLDELYSTQSILIAELVPMNGYDDLNRKVCIEPFSRSSASMRFLNIVHVPHDVNLTDVAVDDDYPIGPHLAGTKLQIELPEAPLPPEDRSYQLNMKVPSFIKNNLNQPKNIQEKKPMGSQKSEESIERIVQLPTDVNMFGKELKKLYLETLYTQKDTMDNTIIIIDRCISHLLQSNYTKQDIISTLFDYTMPVVDLDIKHRNEITQASHKPTGQSTLEQTYLYEWWREIKFKHQSDSNFEKISCVTLKVKEAQLQVILYCFICKLIDGLPLDMIKRDPFSLAEDFFAKVVVIFSMNNITDFLTGQDSEEGSYAIKRRDPCNLSDHAFVQVLEKRFNGLPELTQKFKESAGGDDMASSPSSLSSMDDDLDIDYSLQPNKESSIESLVQKTYQTRVNSDTHILKSHKSSTRPVASSSRIRLEPRSAKAILPQKMNRVNSNPIDSFLKRTVSVTSGIVTTTEKNRGEATKAAIAKVNRSMLNGRPTMKRTGSFTKSAQSPKRVKRTASMLFPQETTGTVILRRDNNIPNPETTPRTSLNRYLNANIFGDYSEPCLSPSSSKPTDSYVQSEYPHVPTTPQGTPMRYRKIMMDRTPHRRKSTSDGEDFSLVLGSQEDNPPYTPRTAHRRARDRIDRSEPLPNPGRNLTMKFQNMLQEEKAQEGSPVKRNIDIFSDTPDSSTSQQENVNPFLSNDNSQPTATTTTTRPILRKAKTIDDIFSDHFEPSLIDSPEHIGIHYSYEDDEDDEDSDTD